MREGWARTTIGEIAEVTGGGTPKTSIEDYWGGPIPWITPTEVTAREGSVITSTERTLTEKGLAKSGARLLPAGSVLLTSRATIGAVALAGVAMATNQGFASLVPGPTVLPEYLMCWCQAHRADFVARGGGNTFLEVSKTNVKAVPIELPPLDEQRRIVDLVTAVDGTHNQACAAADAAHRTRVALREAVFDSPTQPRIELRSVCEPDGIQIGPFGSQLHASDYVDDGIPSVMPQDIVQGRINEGEIRRVGSADWSRLSRHHLRKDDIVLPRRGDLTKRALVEAHQDGWLCGTGSVRVRISDADPRVVFEALSVRAVDQWLADNAVGITMPNLNTAIVSSIPIRLPSNADTALAELTTLRDYEAAAIELSERLAALRSALLAGLLSGEHEISASYDLLMESA